MVNETNAILNSLFCNYIQLPNDYFIPLLQRGEFKHLPKNTVLKRAFEVENNIRLIISGSCGFFIHAEDNEKCLYFVFENALLVDYVSFAFNLKTEFEIKTLEKTLIFEVSKEEYFKFIFSNPLGEKVHRIGLDLLYADLQQLYLDILSLNATQRYIKLLEKQKHIAQKIDHKHIASFLGITPQSLSRLRKSLLRQAK